METEVTAPAHARLDGSARQLIAAGLGRNEVVRRRQVSTGMVSKIARERGLWFERCTQVATASAARQIDMWAARVDREAELEARLDKLEVKQMFHDQPSRKRNRLSYALYNLERHHNGRYPRLP